MLQWQLKKFDELSLLELYTIMYLRQEVFVVEQKCPFIDADGKDIKCHHLSGYLDGELVAYARIVPPGVSYAEPSIGRIVTALKYRRTGLGKKLMDESLKVTAAIYGQSPIRIEAQLYLKAFYENYGFVQQTEPYDLDDILHIIMVRNP